MYLINFIIESPPVLQNSPIAQITIKILFECRGNMFVCPSIIVNHCPLQQINGYHEISQKLLGGHKTYLFNIRPKFRCLKSVIIPLLWKLLEFSVQSERENRKLKEGMGMK